MDKLIDSRFERVEKALVTLIHSISTYNPSPNFANDMVAADAELNQGLEQLSTHQSNYSKILALRSTASNLDSQIRETLTLLTTTRSELIATPATTFPTSTNPVSYSDLLSYARRISKFTLPPTYRESELQPGDSSERGPATGNATPKDTKSESHTNGTTTPVAVLNGIVERNANAMDLDSSVEPPASQQAASASAAADTQATTTTSLPPAWTTFLDPYTNQPFIPWPAEDKLRRGALASIQVLVDQGIDPATFDPDKSAELEAERKRLMEEEDLAREQERERLDLERRREMERRMSISGGGAGERAFEHPKQFELETFDDDDDD